MKKTHAEKTGSFVTYDNEDKEYLVHEFTHFDDIQVPEQPPQKIPIVQFYKTETGEHVQKKTNTDFVILTAYGAKNIEVHIPATVARRKAQKAH